MSEQWSQILHAVLSSSVPDQHCLFDPLFSQILFPTSVPDLLASLLLNMAGHSSIQKRCKCCFLCLKYSFFQLNSLLLSLSVKFCDHPIYVATFLYSPGIPCYFLALCFSVAFTSFYHITYFRHYQTSHKNIALKRQGFCLLFSHCYISISYDWITNIYSVIKSYDISCFGPTILAVTTGK